MPPERRPRRAACRIGKAGGSRPESTISRASGCCGFGYGRNLSGSDFAERFTPHCNVVWEKPTGHSPALSVFEGVEYQMTPRFALDLSAQHFTVTGGVTDYLILFGIAVTFGKLQ